MKMEQIDCSETSAFNNQTPGKYLKDYTQDSKQGESLKSRVLRYTINFLQKPQQSKPPLGPPKSPYIVGGPSAGHFVYPSKTSSSRFYSGPQSRLGMCVELHSLYTTALPHVKDFEFIVRATRKPILRKIKQVNAQL
jgi:hypothetical protein